MATITAGDFRNGKTFEYDGKVMQVVEFQHVKPGKGSPFVRTKMKNVITGAVTETSFNPTDKFEEAFIERTDVELSLIHIWQLPSGGTFHGMPSCRRIWIGIRFKRVGIRGSRIHRYVRIHRHAGIYGVRIIRINWIRGFFRTGRSMHLAGFRLQRSQM